MSSSLRKLSSLMTVWRASTVELEPYDPGSPLIPGEGVSKAKKTTKLLPLLYSLASTVVFSLLSVYLVKFSRSDPMQFQNTLIFSALQFSLFVVLNAFFWSPAKQWQLHVQFALVALFWSFRLVSGSLQLLYFRPALSSNIGVAEKLMVSWYMGSVVCDCLFAVCGLLSMWFDAIWILSAIILFVQDLSAVMIIGLSWQFHVHIGYSYILLLAMIVGSMMWFFYALHKEAVIETTVSGGIISSAAQYGGMKAFSTV